MAIPEELVDPLAREMVDIYEQDRKLVAYEIHDGLSQMLACALYKFQLAERLHDEDLTAAKQACDEGVELLHEALAETRRLITGLRPPVLDEYGVVAAIRGLVDDHHQRDRVEIEFVNTDAIGRLAVPLETALFRIAQECLTNACRHSQSDRICVTLRVRDDRVILEVRDWGVGFDPAHLPSGHFGLRGIKERAHLLGGIAAIQAAPGCGTHVFVDLPLIPQDANAVA